MLFKNESSLASLPLHTSHCHSLITTPVRGGQRDAYCRQKKTENPKRGSVVFTQLRNSRGRTQTQAAWGPGLRSLPLGGSTSRVHPQPAGAKHTEGKLTIGPPYCSVPQSCLFATPWTAARQASRSCTISWSLLKIMSTESMMPSNHLILCCPLLCPRPSIFPSISLFH